MRGSLAHKAFTANEQLMSPLEMASGDGSGDAKKVLLDKGIYIYVTIVTIVTIYIYNNTRVYIY